MPPPIERSVIALHRKARDGAQQVRFLAEALQMLDRLVDQEVRLAPRPFGAEQRDEGLLAGGEILADALARFLLHPLMVDQVVDDLEGEADIARIAPEPGPALGRDPA